VASGINNVLDISKREALSAIVAQMDINFPSIRTRIQEYINNSNNFDSLLALYNPKFNVLSSDVITATLLLGYLDFYSLYTILYANNLSIANLISVTKNKMSYLSSIYRSTQSTLREKELQKENKYALYTNFLDPRHIDLSSARLMLAKNRLVEALSFFPILTLPVSLTRDIKPISISCSDSDNSINIIENLTSGNNIDYSVNRKGFGKIGVVDTIYSLSPNNKYQEMPVISGTIQGYYSDELYIIIKDITMDGSYVASVDVIGSSNNIDWSDPVTILTNTPTNFNIDNNLNVGLELLIKFIPGIIAPAAGDSWKVILRYLEIDDPKMSAMLRFNSLDQSSYLTWEDLSKESSDLSSSKIKFRNLEQYQTQSLDSFFTNGVTNILPIFNSVSDMEVSLSQKDYTIDQIGSNFVHKFNFNMSNTKCVYNEYDSFGITSFKKIIIKESAPILNVYVSTKKIISNDSRYVIGSIGPSGRNFSKQFIEQYVAIASTYDYIYVPYSEDELYVNEYILPNTMPDGSIEYTTRFPVDKSIAPLVYNLSSSLQIGTNTASGANVAYERINSGNATNEVAKLTFASGNYNARNIYVVSYKIKSHTFNEVNNYTIDFTQDTDWIYNKDTPQNSTIFYMYYVDLEGKNRIAVCTRSSQDGTTGNTITIKPFFGSVAGVVQMRSLDRAYVSPMIFEYSLICN
jgi:hypothetical protein